MVDTMRQFLNVEKWNDDALVAAAMRPWVGTVSREAEKTVVFVHHNRKGGGEHGEEIAGSHEILAAVDIAVILKRVGEDQDTRRRKVSVFGREIEDTTFLYEMADTDARSLRYLGHADAVSLAQVQERVLEVLAGPMSTEAVRGALDEPRPSTRQVLNALTALAESRRIDRDPPIGAPAAGRRVTWCTANLARPLTPMSGPCQVPVPLGPEYESGPERLNTRGQPRTADTPTAASLRGSHPPTPYASLADLNERHQR
jgi:hypothetical protein